MLSSITVQREHDKFIEVGDATAVRVSVSGDPATGTKQDEIIAKLNSFSTNDVYLASSTITYIGEETVDGEWLVNKLDTTSGLAKGYATIKNNPTYSTYSSAWNNKATLVYNNYADAF